VFPEAASGSEALLHGGNYDRQNQRYAAPNLMFKDIADEDWVRISGVIRPNSKVERLHKFPHWLTLGSLTITRIERL
jgi:hypothetical protein